MTMEKKIATLTDQNVTELRKRSYSPLTVEAVELDAEGALLTGSIVSVAMKVNKVEVEDFDDGFAAEGGFKELNFD